MLRFLALGTASRSGAAASWVRMATRPLGWPRGGRACAACLVVARCARTEARGGGRFVDKGRDVFLCLFVWGDAAIRRSRVAARHSRSKSPPQLGAGESEQHSSELVSRL